MGWHYKLAIDNELQIRLLPASKTDNNTKEELKKKKKKKKRPKNGITVKKTPL